MALPTKANVSRPLAGGYGALFEYGDTDAESLYLRLAVGPGRAARFETVEAPPQAVNTAATPEDLRGESGQPFSRDNFTGGAGLDRAHRRGAEEIDDTRFWDSRNIDITPARAGQAEELKLLHATASIRSADASNTRMPMVRIGTVLYAVSSDDALVDRTANPTASTPTFSTENPGGTGDITDLTVLGDQLYAARSTVRVRTSAGSWSQFSNLASVLRVWGVKGRIIGSTGAALYEVRSGDGSVLLHTLPSGQVWTDVIDAGAAILAGASNGEIHAFVDQDGELELRGQTVIEAEAITALGFGGGLVFVGTGESTTAGGQVGRLYRFLLVGLRLREGEVLREWGTGTETRDRAPYRIISTREAVWTALIEDGSETHLWRYHLETGGLVRDLILGASGVAHGLVVIDDRVFATVFGSGIWREATTYASSGYLIGPLADFFSAARKAWVGARLSTGTIPSGATVVLAYSTDPTAIENAAHASWVNVISATSAAPGAGVEQSITEVESRYLAGKLTLTPPGGAASTPTVLAYAFRGVSLPTEDDYALPINVSDRIEVPNRKALTSPAGAGYLAYDKLHEIKGMSGTLTILRTGEQVIGQLRAISTPIESAGHERGSLPVYSLVTMRGLRQ